MVTRLARSIFPLPNGNYVAVSSSWDSGASQTGAVTFCSGTAGRVGAVTSQQQPGRFEHDRWRRSNVFPGGVFPIANSDYIVLSPMWTNGGIWPGRSS